MARFKPGQSGNPAGRPKGAVNRATKMRQEIEKSGNKLVAQLIRQALEGDPASLKLCIDRLLPPIKAQAEPVRFDLDGDTLTEQAHSILAAIAQGELDPATGRALLAAVADLAKITEIDELEQRITALEAQGA